MVLIINEIILAETLTPSHKKNIFNIKNIFNDIMTGNTAVKLHDMI